MTGRVRGVVTRVSKRPGVARVMRRSKSSEISAGRPRLSCSAMVASNHCRPRRGRSKTRVSLTSSWIIERAYTRPAARSSAVSGWGSSAIQRAK